MRARCVPTRATVQARGVSGLTASMRSHTATCTGCSAAVADAQVLDIAFADARAFEYTAPADIEQRVLAATGPWAVPDPQPVPRRPGKVAAVAAVATAATTAAVGTAVIVLRRRHRAA